MELPKVGRPTKLNDDVQKIICDAIREGCTYEIAAGAAGIARSTLNDWRRRGEDGNEAFLAFSDAIKKAEAEAARDAVRCIVDAAQNGTWQAAAWLLERRYPQDWGRRPVTVAADHDDEEQIRIFYVNA